MYGVFSGRPRPADSLLLLLLPCSTPLLLTTQFFVATTTAVLLPVFYLLVHAHIHARLFTYIQAHINHTTAPCCWVSHERKSRHERLHEEKQQKKTFFYCTEFSGNSAPLLTFPPSSSRVCDPRPSNTFTKHHYYTCVTASFKPAHSFII